MAPIKPTAEPNSQTAAGTGTTAAAVWNRKSCKESWCLSNSNATNASDRCTPLGTTATAGYEFLYQVNEVPAPPAVWLLGTGLAGLVARRLRKQKTV